MSDGAAEMPRHRTGKPPAAPHDRTGKPPAAPREGAARTPRDRADNRPASPRGDETRPLPAACSAPAAELPPPNLDLDPPSTFVFTGEICTRAYRLNRFAFDFKHADVRARFLQSPEELMDEYGLGDTEKALLRARDWTGLVAYGGHHFNVIKIAAAVGESHLHVGAHMCGADWDALKHVVPRLVELMPEDV